MFKSIKLSSDSNGNTYPIVVIPFHLLTPIGGENSIELDDSCGEPCIAPPDKLSPTAGVIET
jgi:hypothetical protein